MVGQLQNELKQHKNEAEGLRQELEKVRKKCTCGAGGGRKTVIATGQPIVAKMSALEQVRKIKISNDLKKQLE